MFSCLGVQIGLIEVVKVVLSRSAICTHTTEQCLCMIPLDPELRPMQMYMANP